jgi:hypothetical protein
LTNTINDNDKKFAIESTYRSFNNIFAKDDKARDRILLMTYHPRSTEIGKEFTGNHQHYSFLTKRQKRAVD